MRDFVEHTAGTLDGLVRDEPRMDFAEQADAAAGNFVDVYV